MTSPSLWIPTVSLLLSAAIPHPALAQSLILPEGMAIRLETRTDMSSKSARAGDKVELAVAKPVTIGGTTLIPAGSPATGEVVRARDNGLLGRSGKLDIRVDSIKVGAVDVPVRGKQSAKGKSGTLGAVGAGVLFLPLAVIVRGKDVKLPAGTLLEVYVDKEVTIASQATPNAAPPEETTPPPSVIRNIDPNEAISSQ